VEYEEEGTEVFGGGSGGEVSIVVELRIE